MASVSLGGGLPGIYGCLWPLSPLAEGCQVYTAVYRLCLPLTEGCLVYTAVNGQAFPLQMVARYIWLFMALVSLCGRLPCIYGCL